MTTALRFNGIWNTQDEMTFIDGLGIWRGRGVKIPDVTAAQRIKLIRCYISALNLRRQWTHLDRYQIESHAEKRIRELEKLSPTTLL